MVGIPLWLVYPCGWYTLVVDIPLWLVYPCGRSTLAVCTATVLLAIILASSCMCTQSNHTPRSRRRLEQNSPAVPVGNEVEDERLGEAQCLTHTALAHCRTHTALSWHDILKVTRSRVSLAHCLSLSHCLSLACCLPLNICPIQNAVTLSLTDSLLLSDCLPVIWQSESSGIFLTLGPTSQSRGCSARIG